jgi:hypothetical protein
LEAAGVEASNESDGSHGDRASSREGSSSAGECDDVVRDRASARCGRSRAGAAEAIDRGRGHSMLGIGVGDADVFTGASGVTA